MRSAMSSTLPPELWLEIFNEVIGLSISPADECDYITFPDISNRLYWPWEQRPKDPRSLCNLRLVCKDFRAMLGTSPHFFIQNGHIDIPIGARVVYFSSNPEDNSYTALQQLLADPLRSSHIVSMDAPLLCRGTAASTIPLICNELGTEAKDLPALRSLTLHLEYCSSELQRFWSRLQEGLPNLTCLVLREGYRIVTEDGPVSFDRLEVLVMDDVLPHPNVTFPALRHFAIGCIRPSQLAQFSGGSKLESLLIRYILHGEPVDWSILPQLRLLGIPALHLEAFAPLPSSHPLQHLYVYVETFEPNNPIQSRPSEHRDLIWLKDTLERLPTISRITLEFPKQTNRKVSSLSGSFDKNGLADTGFAVNYAGGKTHSGRSLFVMERIPQPTKNVDLKKRKGFRAGLEKFRQHASDKLHR